MKYMIIFLLLIFFVLYNTIWQSIKQAWYEKQIWNDPDYLKDLEKRAEIDEVLNRYEKGHE